MSRYGTGLIAIMAFVVFAAAGHSTLSSHTTMDVAKGTVPEFTDEQRGRIFDGVMRISEAPVTDMAAPEVAELFAGGVRNAGASQRHHPRDSAGSRT